MLWHRVRKADNGWCEKDREDVVILLQIRIRHKKIEGDNSPSIFYGILISAVNCNSS